MAHVALFIGLFVVTLGTLGVAVPELFMSAFRVFQAPPMIYLVAVFRVVVGIVLLCAAPASRVPRTLRALGCVIAIAGVVSPFVGGRLAQFVLDWSLTAGPALVRVWAGVVLALGIFIVYAVAPVRRAD